MISYMYNHIVGVTGGRGREGEHNGPNFAFVALIRLFFKLLVQ